MSGQKIPVWGWRDAIEKSKAPPLAKLVCHTLANYVSDVGAGCWPGTKLLLAGTGLSNKTLSKHLQSAIEFGLLEIRRVKAEDGRFAHNHYFPRFPKNVTLPEPSDDGSDVSQAGGTPSVGGTLGPSEALTPGPVYFAPGPSVGGTHKLPNEQSIEQSTARKRAPRLGKHKSEKVKGKPVDLNPSPDALKRGYELARGWDKAELLNQFRGMNAENDVTDVDRAWLGFCNFTGVHPSAKTYKVTGKYDPREKPGLVLKERDGACWKDWLAYLHATGKGKAAEEAVKRGTLTVPSRWPKRASPPEPIQTDIEQLIAEKVA